MTATERKQAIHYHLKRARKLIGTEADEVFEDLLTDDDSHTWESTHGKLYHLSDLETRIDGMVQETQNV